MTPLFRPRFFRDNFVFFRYFRYFSYSMVYYLHKGPTFWKVVYFQLWTLFPPHCPSQLCTARPRNVTLKLNSKSTRLFYSTGQITNTVENAAEHIEVRTVNVLQGQQTQLFMTLKSAPALFAWQCHLNQYIDNNNNNHRGAWTVVLYELKRYNA